jgi:hypothetical protein
MKITPLYVSVLPDGRIIEGGTTAASAVDAARSAGVDGNIIVDDIGTLGTPRRSNPTRNGLPTKAERAEALDKALLQAGLPTRVTKEEVFALTPEQAMERLRPLFCFLVSEQRKSVATTTPKLDAEGKPKLRKVVTVVEEDGEQKKVVTYEPSYEMKTKAVVDPVGRPVLGRTNFVTSKNPSLWAKELMGRNAKLVKDTMNNRNATSLDTRVSGDLLGLNLYPANKLATEFVETYGPKAEAAYENWVDAGRPMKGDQGFDANTMRVYGFNHPLSQIIVSVGSGRGVPASVMSLPMGQAQQKARISISATSGSTGRYDEAKHHLSLTQSQVENIKRAFRSRDKFTTCAGASGFCMNTCLVYTGQNTSAFQNDWKKATCLFALIADPVAYLRLLVLALDEAGYDASNSGTPFFVRMNLLSDIPWERMVPWLFGLYEGAPDAWYKNAPKVNPSRRRSSRPQWAAWQRGGSRDFPVQFYDYTKVFERDPSADGIANYDLTFSFSGTNAEECALALYERGQRLAVVFAGVKLKKEGGREVYQRALYSAPKKANPAFEEEGEMVEEADGEVTSEEAAEDITAKYGYGLPVETNMFARPKDLARRGKGMRAVVNSDRHDARPLDPPNLLTRVPVIAGLAWKSTGGGLTITDKKKNRFTFRAEQLVGMEGWQVVAPGNRPPLVFEGRGQKGRAEREARRLTSLENIRQAKAFVTPTLLVEGTDTFVLVDRERVFAEGVYIVAETPREAHVGVDGLSALPGTSS